MLLVIVLDFFLLSRLTFNFKTVLFAKCCWDSTTMLHVWSEEAIDECGGIWYGPSAAGLTKSPPQVSHHGQPAVS